MRKGLGIRGHVSLLTVGAGLLALPLGAFAFQGAAAPAAAEPAKQSAAKCSASAPAWYDAAKRRAQERKTGLRPVKVINTNATWYGPGFHGRRTANGERFNQNAMTLASRNLPFGTRVRVVNPKTGKAAVARVNDRGPFGKKGYTADLSKGLAHEIGLKNSGPVRLEVLPEK
jgi:rare lipoprotein A